MFIFYRKAFEEGEHGICEEDLIRSNINIRSNEQYVDIDDCIHDDITINSEDEANDQDTVEEDDSSKFWVAHLKLKSSTNSKIC